MSAMKKILDSITLAVAPLLARLIIRSLRLSMRITYVNFDWYRKHLREGGQIILAFWHSRLLMMPYGYPGKGITTLSSQHRDSELIVRTIKGFGITAVRGSSTRGWITGLKGVLRTLAAGRDIAITPDGPKGPAMKAQMGIVQIARATGLPIVPVSFGASKKKPSRAGIPS